MTEVEIILIRHGEAASSWGDDPDPGLSNLGKDQAEAVKENLESFKSQNFQLISSPKKRAIETAQPTSLDWLLPRLDNPGSGSSPQLDAASP